MKGKVSTTGYRSNSKDKGNDFNIIPSGRISMSGVPHAVFGIDEFGNARMMYPNEEIQFPGDRVLEIPMHDEMRHGGQRNLKKRSKTSKNIKSSINELFLRNYDVYRLPGKHIYDPKAQEGGQMNYFPIPPHYFQQGGEPVDYDFDYSEDYDEFKEGGNWIPKHLNKGRCTPGSPNYDCPKGSPQWRLAQTFKKHHGFHQMGGEPDYMNDFDNPFFQMGGAPSFKTPDEFHQYYQKRGYKLVPNSKMEYYNPSQYTPSDSTNQLAPWKAMNNAPLTTGNYPAQTFGYTAPKPAFNPKASNFIDTSANPYELAGPGIYYNKKTGQHVPAAQVMQERKAQVGPGMKRGGQPCVECGEKMFEGGGEYLKSLVKAAYKDVTKRQKGGSSPQGATMDDVLAQRNNTFKNYLANNTLYHLAMEESDNFQQMHKAMKGYMQQGGFTPADSSDDYWNTLPGYNGGQNIVNVGSPATNTPNFNFNPIDNNGQKPITSYMSSDQLVGQQSVHPQISAWNHMSNDMQKAAFEQGPQQKQNWFQRNKGPLMAEGIIAGMNLLAAGLNTRNTRANENLLKQRMTADNQFQGNTKQNRGDYEVNSGMLRPNQYTTTQYQKGGETYMSDVEIARLKKLGYQIELLD